MRTHFWINTCPYTQNLNTMRINIMDHKSSLDKKKISTTSSLLWPSWRFFLNSSVLRCHRQTRTKASFREFTLTCWNELRNLNCIFGRLTRKQRRKKWCEGDKIILNQLLTKFYPPEQSSSLCLDLEISQQQPLWLQLFNVMNAMSYKTHKSCHVGRNIS